MTADSSGILATLLGEAEKAGCDAADAILIEDRSVSIEVRTSSVEHVERSESAEVGLRVLVGRRQACVSVSDMRPEVLARVARQAVAMAKEAPEDPFAGLADPELTAAAFEVEALELRDQSSAPGMEMLIERALAAERAAAAVEGVDQVESASAGFGTASIGLATSNGFSGSYERGYSGCSCAAIAGTGLEMEVDYYGELRVFDSDLSSPEEIGNRAGERAVERFRPKRPKTGAFPVIFDERVASTLIRHLLSAINGASVARGASWLLDAMGQEVLPKGMDIIEQPKRPRSGSSRPFDAEGLAQRDKAFVKDGELKSWVLDLSSARKLELESTGNAYRGTSSPPSPGVSNVELTPGSGGRDRLAREMGTGLIVTSLIGSTINPTTGDYSRGAGGLWVENGSVTGPVSGFTIAGNLRRMLKSIIAADDARPFASYRVPSLLVEGLTIAGD